MTRNIQARARSTTWCSRETGWWTTLVDALVPPFLIPSVPLVAASIQHGDFTLLSQATSLLWVRRQPQRWDVLLGQLR